VSSAQWKAVPARDVQVVTSCEVRQRFRNCGQPGIAICQYCGQSFCAQHGARLADGQEICSRSTCQRKKADLERHFAYKEGVGRRNEERRCGEADCDEWPGGQCSKCGGLFCPRHLEQREVEQRRSATTTRVRGSLCRHCRKRRNLWSQV